MIEKILLATDGSDHAKKATNTAIELAKQLQHVKVIIFHVRGTQLSRRELVDAHFDVEGLLRQEARGAVQDTIAHFHREGIAHGLEVALGDPATEIIKYAHETKVDMIVIGSRCLNPLNEVLLGSVSHKVVHEAACPVMVVK